MKCPQCGSAQPSGTNFCGNCGAALHTESEEAKSFTKTLITRRQLLIGAEFADRYRVIEDLGKGGMGRVYKALDTKIDEKVALKVLNPEIATDEKTITRFRNELKLTRKISHRRICRLFDLGEAEGLTYISMEYVSGEDLKTLMRRIGRISAGKAAFIVRQICEGLAEAHGQGVIHRDLKPQNIMIDKEGDVRIMDFGIARSLRTRGITEAGVIMGTPEYMSPEQVEGRDLDQRSDIYSLGVIFYEMLTGQTPFSGDTPLTVAVKQKTEIPVDPRKINSEIPENINRVILRCLEKDKARRFQTTGELLEELKRIEQGLPSTDRVIPERRTRSREITVKFNPKRLAVPTLALAFAAILVFFGLRLVSDRGETLLASGKPSLAVMHFENNTGDNNLEHWRKALSDLLIADLSQSRFLEVMSAEDLYDILEEQDLLQAQSYSSRNLRDVANRAGVQYVLVGKMTQAGDTIRLNTILQDIQNDHVVASERVEGPGEESLFELVDQLTTRIKDDFQLSARDLANDIDKDVKNITTSSPEALNYYKEGLKYHHRADYAKSIPLMELAIAIDPEFAMAYRNLSTAYSNLGLTSEAHRHLQKAFDLSDRVSERERFYIMGDYYRGTEQDQDKAIDAYSKLLELYPDDEIGNNNLGILYLGLEQWDKAELRFESNLRSNDSKYHSYFNLASLHIVQGKYEEAEQVLREYLSRNADHPRIRAGLARIYLLQGRYREALEQADAALALDSGFYEYYFLKGSVLYAQGDTGLAEAEFHKLLDSNQPGAHQIGHWALSTLYLAQGRADDARGQLLQGIEMAQMVGEKGWEHQFRVDLAYANLTAGALDEALKSCEESKNVAEDAGSLSMRKTSLFCRGMILLEKGVLDQAEATIAELGALLKNSLNPKEMRLHYFLTGRMLTKTGDYREAVVELDRAIQQLSPKDALRSLVVSAKAETLFLSGNLRAAESLYREITNPVSPDLASSYEQIRGHYMLGKVYQGLGKTGDARSQYQRFLEFWKQADTELAEVQDARRQLSEL